MAQPLPSSRAPAKDAKPPPPSILLVEDDEPIREAISDLLEDEGYEVDKCVDALEALEVLESGHAPDLILLDLMMPRMDGWEFRVRQLRDPSLSGIPVIALSADSSAKARAMNVDAYLQKPVNDKTLLDTISRLLGSLQEERSRARALEFERLSSLGVLSAGIAHEINNPLSFVSGNLELARQKCEELGRTLSPEAAASLKHVDRLLHHAQRGAGRIAEVVRSVSTFSRPDTGEVASMDVREVLESSVQLVANEIKHRARLERDYEAVPPVVGNPAKLGQALLNLLIQAVHAIDEGASNQHVIRVATERGPAGEAVISISDTGQGTLPRFGGGQHAASANTQTGVTISQRIIGEMGGSLRVVSSPSHGSTFRVTLPQVQSTPQAVAPLAEPSEERASAAGRRAKVLVVDDEQLMCDLLSAMLEDEYDVTALSSAREALARLQKGETFDLVLCDLMMPELTGMDLYGELARVRPDQAGRMVFMTGGTFTERAYKFLEEHGRLQLQKPFRHEQLLTLVRTRLGELARTADANLH
jgi:CheY-like chemotaxis protein